VVAPVPWYNVHLPTHRCQVQLSVGRCAERSLAWLEPGGGRLTPGRRRGLYAELASCKLGSEVDAATDDEAARA
jgi:hypothetical protein